LSVVFLKVQLWALYNF